MQLPGEVKIVPDWQNDVEKEAQMTLKGFAADSEDEQEESKYGGGDWEENMDTTTPTKKSIKRNVFSMKPSTKSKLEQMKVFKKQKQRSEATQIVVASSDDEASMIEVDDTKEMKKLRKLLLDKNV